MLIADFTLGDALLTVLEIFLFVIYLWILITIIGDLFRDHQLSGWAKAGWILLLLVLPFLGALIYLIARGEGMRDRTVREQADMRRHMDAYIRETAGTGSSVDELAKLSELKDKGAISDEEFERAKAKLLA
jgi:ABC-type transport system involved in cytochrome bd biosynthesis fused ATPase/permease subunit